MIDAWDTVSALIHIRRVYLSANILLNNWLENTQWMSLVYIGFIY